MRGLLLLVVMASAVGFVGAQSDAAKADLKKLQGTWTVVSVIADGKEEQVKQAPWTIKDNKIIYDAGNYDVLTVNVGKAAHIIDGDCVRTNKKIDKNTTVSFRYKAIYKIDGDTAVLCIDPKNQLYPQSFQSKAGSGFRLITIRRLKA